MTRNPQAHLTQDEFIGFALEELPDELEKELDQHLENCVSCAQQLDDFYTAQEEFPAEAWAAQRGAFVAALRQQIFGTPLRMRLGDALRQAKESLQALFAREPAWAAAAYDEERRKIWDWQSRDGTLSGHAVLERNGDLTFRFASTELGLHGAGFNLRLGSLRREVVLRRVSETEVGTKVVIPRHERPSDATAVSFDVDY